MALDPQTLEEIGSGFLDALQLSAEARHRLDFQLNQLAELLPRPDTWATLGQGDEATLALLTGDVLLIISRETAAEEETHLVVSAQRLRISQVRYRRINQHTVWDFQLRDRDPLRVEGRMGYPIAPGKPETFDQAEAFARTLAANIGWPIVERASVRDQEPRDHELADTGSSAQSDSSRKQVTDVWGNPISKISKPKRRNR